jgi:predicted transcriptional regulator
MGRKTMNEVILGVTSDADVNHRLAAAFEGTAQPSRISFSSVALLWKVISPRRWDILTVMTGQGPMAIRELARRVKRDVKAVHGDVQALIGAGVLDRTERGVVFPYDSVHVDFTLVKAA